MNFLKKMRHVRPAAGACPPVPILFSQRRWITGERLAWLFFGLMGGHGVSWAQTPAQTPEASGRQVVAVLPRHQAFTPTHAAFDGLLNSAMSAHPNVRSALSQAQGAQLDVDVAKWAFWPALTVNAQRTDSPQNALPGASNFTIQQPLWNAGALAARLSAAEKAGQASGEQIEVVRGDLGLRLVDAWASLLDAEATRSVTERALVGLNRYQAIMQRRVQAGLSSAVDLRLLSVRVTRAQTDLADAQVSSQIALQRLEQLAGSPVQSVLSDLREPLPRSDLSRWVSAQPALPVTDRLAQLPAVRKAELDAAVAAQQLTAQKADRWPKVVLSYQHRWGALPTNFDRGLWAVGLNYTPGAGLATISQSAADQARLQARLEAIESVRQEKQEQLTLDWAALQREFDRQGSLLATIDSAGDVLASYERLYFSGLKTWIEVLNAQQELTQSELRLAQSGNATTLAYYRWRLRGGDLPLHADWIR
jgi:adhesin transport system outer membrane protein